ncbi:caspase family protein [Novosphingobium sp. B 225]|uniref:caspase family protein n=1 Tax=Novosphingobium sp. B 225 TaxID=1961849 RepID=UPI001595FBE9|nr:caspase family protein [Novosphingobium sp. B 225]
MKLWWPFALPLLLMSAPALASPVTRALFVGIDKYLHSKSRVPSADFADLRGAVADSMLMKYALERALQVTFDQPVADSCESRNLLSVTLTDRCATRAAILAALTERVRASARGDTVIFYFAGHGSTVADDQEFDQAGGYNSTLLPADARKPGAPVSNDIYDREIRGLIDVANVRGVNVITVFDSCNSGTAARGFRGEGMSRGVKGIQAKAGKMWVPDLPASGSGGGYRVHFGAARDDEEAREVTLGGSVNGVFTTAFTQALLARPDATFGDLVTTIRLKLERDGVKRQYPQAEGQLAASFGGTTGRAALFDARPQGQRVVLGAGRLLGMSLGSKFALYDSQRAALDPNGAPLASGAIVELADGQATLQLDAPPASPLGNRLIARETAHVWGSDRLKVSVSEAVPRAQSRLIKALSGLGFVEMVPAGDPGELNLLRYGGTEEGPVELYARDGSGLATLGEVSDAQFADRLRTALLAIYKARRLIALPTRSSKDAELALCISTKLDHPVQVCPEPEGQLRQFAVDVPVVLTLTNNAEAARYMAVLVIDDKYGITQLIPTGQGQDVAMAGGAQQRPPRFKFDSSGLYRFVIFASDAPINVATLEQAPLRFNYAQPCDPETEDCTAKANTARDGAIPVLGNWTITVEDALIEFGRP